MKLILSYILLFHLAFLEIFVAFPVPDEANTKLSNIPITLKMTTGTGLKLKSQLSKSPKQDEEEGGDYAGGLVDRLVGFGQSIFKEDFTLGKVFAGAATFIPGEAGNSVGNILDNIAAPFNALVEKPLQKVQELILGNPTPLNATNLSTEKSNTQPAIAGGAQSIPVSNSQAVSSNDPSSPTVTTAPAQPESNSPVQSSVAIPNQIQPAPAPVIPTVNNHNIVQSPKQPIEHRPALANEINIEEDDGDENEDEDNDNAKA